MGRAVVLVPAALALWWFLLKPASLRLLRVTAYLPLALLVAPAGLDPVRVDQGTGEWLFNVAVRSEVKDPRTGQRHMVDSMEFAASEDNVACFACGWFSYLALGFSAASSSRAAMKPLLKGAGLQTCLNVLTLAAYVYINGYGAVINTPGAADFRIWLFHYCYHIIYLVAPFAGPFAVALLVHPEWRECAGLAGRRP